MASVVTSCLLKRALIFASRLETQTRFLPYRWNSSFTMPSFLKTKKEFTEALAAADGKLVVVDFTAAWCGPCQMIAPKFEEFSKTYTDCDFFKVDVDDNTEVAEEQGISAMPTFKFYKNGVKVDEMMGADVAKLEKKIKELK